MSRRQPKVFVPNTGAGHDFSAALTHGSPLVYISEGVVNPFNTGLLMRLWKEALEDSIPEDLIMITSLPIICSIGAALFAHKHGTLNLLIFTKEGKYEKREMLL